MEESIRGKHFLIVEDVPAIAEVMAQMVRVSGGTSVQVTNGQAGVDAFAVSEPGTFDCILMDIRMPVLDGYAAAEAIRALDRPDAKSVPIIAMTAYASEQDQARVRASGMTAYFVKPVRLSEFIQVTASVLKK